MLFTLYSFYGFCLTLSILHSARSELTVEEKLERLSKEVFKRSVIRLNYDKYITYAATSPRNYSMIIMFTALEEKYQCQICRIVHDEFIAAAESWKNCPHYSNDLFFAIVDISDGREVFEKLQLQHAPVIKHYPPRGKPKKDDTMLLDVIGFETENILRWVSDRVQIKRIQVSRPLDYQKIGNTVGVLLIAVCVLAFIEKRFGFLSNVNLWAVLSLIVTFTFLSGQMWNRIRNPPYAGKKEGGAMKYIYGSSGMQFVVETYIVAAMYAGTALGMILMIEAVGTWKKRYVWLRRIQAIVGLLIYAVVFSLQLSVFRMKSGGYPYSLLFK